MPDIKVMINDKVIDTDFFDGFNWFNFEYGEEIYLDDCDETDFLKAEFVYASNNQRDRIVSLFAPATIQNSKTSNYERVIKSIEKQHTLIAAKLLFETFESRPKERMNNIKFLREVLMLAYKVGREENDQ